MINKKKIINNKIIDTLEIARGKYPGTSNSLDALCKRFNVDLSRRTKHNALLDCDLLREVYINLLDVKEPRLIFSDKVEKRKFENNALKYSKAVVKPTENELNNHKEFLKKEMKKNFF